MKAKRVRLMLDLDEAADLRAMVLASFYESRYREMIVKRLNQAMIRAAGIVKFKGLYPWTRSK